MASPSFSPASTAFAPGRAVDLTLASIEGGAEAPHSSEVEEMLLSGVMLDETFSAYAIAQAVGVKTAAFHSRSHGLVWDAIVALRSRGEPAAGAAEVAAELSVRHELETVGGYSFISDVSSRVCTTAQVRYHAEQLVLLWQLRHTLRLAQELRESVAGFQTRDEFRSEVGAIGQRLIRLGHREAIRSAAEMVDDIKADILLCVEGKTDTSRWISTGMATFDKVCLPFRSAREDHYVIIAGGSGHGKSALMRQWAGAALEQGKRVLAYTIETSSEGFLESLIAMQCGVNLLHKAGMPKDRLLKFAAECDRYRDEVCEKRLWVVQHEATRPIRKVEELAAHFHAFCHLHGAPDLVVVDYLQLFGTEKRCSNREGEIAEVSGALLALCRASGSLFLVGAQMNEKGLSEQRTLRRDEDGRVMHRLPNPGDLRESQKAYHDADRFIAIYRPPVDSAEGDQSSPDVVKPEQWLCQIKRRKGGTGVVRTWFERSYTRFVDFTGDERSRFEQQAVERTRDYAQKKKPAPGQY